MLTLGTLIKSTEAAKRKEREKEKKEGGGRRVEGGGWARRKTGRETNLAQSGSLPCPLLTDYVQFMFYRMFELACVW